MKLLQYPICIFAAVGCITPTKEASSLPVASLCPTQNLAITDGAKIPFPSQCQGISLHISRGTLTVDRSRPSESQSGQVRLLFEEFTVGEDGIIDLTGSGFQGGEPGYQGSSPVGLGAFANSSANGGGSGGARSSGIGAAGASYGSVGTLGQDGAVGSSTKPGLTYGAEDYCDKLYLGSGGGGIMNFNGYGAVIDQDKGGNGGGALLIKAKSITILGKILANGTAGSGFFGGGGSGGTICLEADTIKVGPKALIQAVGGRGGKGSYRSFGGSGGAGRISLRAKELQISGTVSPDCHRDGERCIAP